MTHFDKEVSHAVDHLCRISCTLHTNTVLGRLSFHQSVAQNSLVALQLAIMRGLRDINECDEEELTALMRAAERGLLPMVHGLVKAGADVDLQDKKGRTALVIAIAQGHVNVALALLRSGSTAVSEDIDRNTPLHHAAAHTSSLELIQLLVRFGASVEATNVLGQRPLHVAVTNRFAVAVPYLGLIESAHAKDGTGRTPIHMASVNGDVESLTLLLSSPSSDPHAVCNTYRRTALHEAANYAVTSLLARLCLVAAVDVRLQTALHRAALQGKDDVVKALLESVGDADASIALRTMADHEKKTALGIAAERGHTQVVAQLATTNEEPCLRMSDNYGLLPIHAACENGHEDVVRLLLAVDPGCVKVAVQHSGATPLHIAALGGHRHVCEILIAKGAEKFVLSSQRRSPLHYACMLSHAGIVELLLDEWATPVDLDHRDTDHRTAEQCLGLLSVPSEATRETIIGSIAKIRNRAAKEKEAVQALKRAQSAKRAAEQHEKDRLMQEKLALLADEAINEIKRVFSYDQLKMPGGLGPEDICILRREEYMSDEDFEAVMFTKKEVFRKWPDKKREAKKVQVGLQPM